MLEMSNATEEEKRESDATSKTIGSLPGDTESTSHFFGFVLVL
jgi:hypothetical protein